MARVTINDIARRAGVSKGAVSYALNGRPGVSASTRQRILAVADELGWAPNRTARMLSGSRTDTFGLILARQARHLGSEPFSMEFVAGLDSVLAEQSYALLLQLNRDLDAEMETYRRWSSERRVDAVAVVDLRVGDPRVALLESLDLPAVFVGDPSLSRGHTTVWTDDASAMADAVGQLASLGWPGSPARASSVTSPPATRPSPGRWPTAVWTAGSCTPTSRPRPARRPPGS